MGGGMFSSISVSLSPELRRSLVFIVVVFLRQLLGSDYMKVELISRINFNPGTRVIGVKPEFICVKDSKVMQFKSERADTTF